MASKISSTKLLHVKAIHLSDGRKLENRNIFIAEGFIIVEPDREDEAPTWYSLRIIDELREVEYLGQQQRNVMRCG